MDPKFARALSSASILVNDPFRGSSLRCVAQQMNGRGIATTLGICRAVYFFIFFIIPILLWSKNLYFMWLLRKLLAKITNKKFVLIFPEAIFCAWRLHEPEVTSFVWWREETTYHLEHSFFSGTTLFGRMANIAEQRIRREFKEVVKSDEVLFNWVFSGYWSSIRVHGNLKVWSCSHPVVIDAQKVTHTSSVGYVLVLNPFTALAR